MISIQKHVYNSDRGILLGSGSYFHLYDGLQGLGFAWILMQLISSV